MAPRYSPRFYGRLEPLAFVVGALGSRDHKNRCRVGGDFYTQQTFMTRPYTPISMRVVIAAGVAPDRDRGASVLRMALEDDSPLYRFLRLITKISFIHLVAANVSALRGLIPLASPDSLENAAIGYMRANDFKRLKLICTAGLPPDGLLKKYLEMAIYGNLEDQLRILSFLLSNSDPRPAFCYKMGSNRAIHFLPLLLEGGADVFYRDEMGRTPLMLNRSPAVQKFLIEHGADVNAVDNDLYSPIMYCLTHYTLFSRESLELLVESGAYVAHRTRRGHTLFHLSILNCNSKMMRFLTRRGGIDPNATLTTGETALDLLYVSDNWPAGCQLPNAIDTIGDLLACGADLTPHTPRAVDGFRALRLDIRRYCRERVPDHHRGILAAMETVEIPALKPPPG